MSAVHINPLSRLEEDPSYAMKDSVLNQVAWGWLLGRRRWFCRHECAETCSYFPFPLGLQQIHARTADLCLGGRAGAPREGTEAQLQSALVRKSVLGWGVDGHVVDAWPGSHKS